MFQWTVAEQYLFHSLYHPDGWLFASQYMSLRAEHHENAQSPMVVTLLGMVTEVRLKQLLNAKRSMLVTLLGMETEVRNLQ